MIKGKQVVAVGLVLGAFLCVSAQVPRGPLFGCPGSGVNELVHGIGWGETALAAESDARENAIQTCEHGAPPYNSGEACGFGNCWSYVWGPEGGSNRYKGECWQGCNHQ